MADFLAKVFPDMLPQPSPPKKQRTLQMMNFKAVSPEQKQEMVENETQLELSHLLFAIQKIYACTYKLIYLLEFLKIGTTEEI